MGKKKSSYVHYSTIWKSVGGGFSNPGESRVCKVGKHKVLVTRSQRLNKYGNPVYTANVINKNGAVSSTYRGSGSATLIVSNALKKSGVSTKYRKK